MLEKQLHEVLISELEERLFVSNSFESPMLNIFDKKNISFKTIENPESVIVKYIDMNKELEISRKYEKLNKNEIATKVFEEFVVPNSILEIDYSTYLKMLLIIMGYFWEEDACIHHYEIVMDMLASGLHKYALELRHKFLYMYTKEEIR